MTAPMLTRALVLETPVRSADGAGGYVARWEVLGTLWAEIVAASGRDLTGIETALSRVILRITVRAAPHGSSMRPQPDQRLLDGERVFAIRAVRERDARGRYLICDAEEQVAR